MSKKKRELKGSYTIEAAVLLPLLFILLWTLFFVICFMYNRVVVSQCAEMAACEGAGLMLGNNYKLEEETTKVAKALLADGVILADEVLVNVKVTNSKVCVSYNVSMLVPRLIAESDFLGKDYFRINVTKTAKRRNNAKFMRICKTIYRLTEQEKEVTQ